MIERFRREGASDQELAPLLKGPPARKRSTVDW
jgi:hypothetical protein